MESEKKQISETTQKRFYGDVMNVIVIANTLAYIGIIAAHANGFSIIEFSPSFSQDGFCVSNKDKSVLLQSHALCFYEDTIFAIFTWLLVKSVKDKIPDREIKVLTRYALSTFVHGAAHLSLAYGDYKRDQEVVDDFENFFNPQRFITLTVFWSTFMWVIHPDYTISQKTLRAIFWTTIHLFMPRLYGFPYVNCVLIMEFSIKEMQVKEVDPFYNIRIPIFNIPNSILAWMEVFACEKFLQPYGGHAIYDAFIPITQIAYIVVLCYYSKKTKKVD